MLYKSSALQELCLVILLTQQLTNCGLLHRTMSQASRKEEESGRLILFRLTNFGKASEQRTRILYQQDLSERQLLVICILSLCARLLEMLEYRYCIDALAASCKVPIPFVSSLIIYSRLRYGEEVFLACTALPSATAWVRA